MDMTVPDSGYMLNFFASSPSPDSIAPTPENIAAPPRDTTTTPPTPPVTSPGFTVQFAALRGEQAANAAASEIEADGQRAHVVHTTQGGLDIWRVVLGPYPTRERAEQAARSTGRSYWIYEGRPWMVADAGPSVKRWEEATRHVAPLLADRTCIVIVGEHDDDAANVALALANAYVRTRRVAIVDAVGELAPLQRLLPRDARSHGVIDHFLHGVSLRKIAHPANPDGTLFVLPSGVGPFDYATLLRRERWRRLTMAFRGEGALMCIVLPPDAEGLAGFVEDTDGIVLVGEVEYPEARHVIARVPRVGRISADAGVLPAVSTSPPRLLSRIPRQAPARRTALLAAGVAILVSGGVMFAWYRTDDSIASAAAAG